MPKHADEDGREYWTRIVYVMELSADACLDPKSGCGRHCGRTPVYVGETCHTAIERFEQHKSGYKSSRWPRMYGRRLRPRLAGSFGEMATVEESQVAEREVARRLRKRAHETRYCLYGGH